MLNRKNVFFSLNNGCALFICNFISGRLGIWKLMRGWRGRNKKVFSKVALSSYCRALGALLEAPLSSPEERLSGASKGNSLGHPPPLYEFGQNLPERKPPTEKEIF